MKNLSQATASAAGHTSARSLLAARINEENPNHHLWNNRGTWWCHFTIHRADYTSERVRVSLKTREVEKARQRRDEILRGLCE